jgi:hypothetical protein
MKNKNLIMLGLIAIGIYAYFDKKKKDQLKPYSDAELKIVLTNFISKFVSEIEVFMGKKVPETTEKLLNELTNIVSIAKQKGKDVSRANVDKFLSLLKKTTLYQEGSTAYGVPTKEEQDFVVAFRLNGQPVGVVQQSQGFVSPKNPIDANFKN